MYILDDLSGTIKLIINDVIIFYFWDLYIGIDVTFGM